MLVDRQLALAVGVAPEVAAEPVREALLDHRGGLAEAPPGERGPALAGVVGDHQRKALVARAGPQRGLAQPRVPDHRHPLGVDRGVLPEAVERPAQPPRPRADRPPVVAGKRGGGTPRRQRGPHALLPAVGAVGLDVAVAGGGQRVAAPDDRRHRPPRRLGAARLGTAVHRQGHVRIVGHRVVALEVQPQERRHRLARPRRQPHQQVQPRAVVRARQQDPPLLAHRRTPERPGRACHQLAPHPTRAPRAAAIDVLLEQAQHLGAPPAGPPGRIRNHRAVGPPQRVGQLIRRHRRLVVVGLPAQDRGNHG